MAPQVQPKKQAANPNTLLAIFAIALCVLNVLFIIFTQTESRDITLLKSQKVNLDQDEAIINSAKEIQDTFQNEVSVISNVFPNEDSLPIFILRLEDMLKNTTDEYSVKFGATEPIMLGDNLYLPIQISSTTDYARLAAFFTQLERAPYMTHIVSVSTKTPNNFTGGQAQVQIVLNLYVQNPFSTK